MPSIEIRPNGAAALFYVDRPRPESWRSNPWGFAAGGLTPLAGQAATTPEAAPVSWRDAFALAGADFTVEARPLFTTRATPDANGKRALAVPQGRGVVRVHDERVLGYSSATRALVQNAEVRACFEASGLSPDSVAVLDNGIRLYAQAVEREDAVRAGDTGRVVTFLTFFWGHTAETGAIRPGRTRVGIVCTNTYGHASASLSGFDSIAHRAGASRRVASLARAMAREAEESAAWLDTSRRMAEVKIATTAQAGRVADLLASAVAGESALFTDLHARSQSVVRDVHAILRRADPRTGVVGDGSLWDVFQAASYYTSHERTVRGLDVRGGALDAARRVADTPDWLGATWDSLAGLAADAAPVQRLVTLQ